MKLKRIVLGFTGIIAVIVPTITIISCGDSKKQNNTENNTEINTENSIENGTITMSKDTFNPRGKVANARANTLPRTWKTVLALDGESHSVNDKSFNEYAYEGIQDGVSTSIFGNLLKNGNAWVRPATDNPGTFAKMYAAIDANSIIVAPGFLHIAPLESTDGKAGISGKVVILLDGDVAAPNIASVKYKSHQAGFLVGYMAGVYLNHTDNYETYKSGGLKVGTFGGLNIEGVTPYMMGFQNGIKYFNANLPENNKKIIFIDNGGKSDYFSGGFEPGLGKQITENLIDKGADLIFPVAGPQTNDVKDVIIKTKSKTKIIGMDVAQEKYSSFKDYVVFSATKNLKISVIKMLEFISGGKSASDFGYNGFGGFGALTIGDLDNGLVGASDGLFANRAAKAAHDALTRDIKNAAKSADTNPLSFDF